MSGLNNALIKLKLVILSLPPAPPVFPQLQFEVPLSPVIAAKKARPSDGGSDEVCVSRRGGPLRIWRRRRSKSGSIPAQFYTVIGGEWRQWGRFKGRHFITADSGHDEGFQMVEISLKILPMDRHSVQRWSLSNSSNEGEAFF